MSWIDWTILLLFLGYTIWDGTRRNIDTENIDGFFLANRSMPWWAMGLSVMATQASAITFIGTTGQAYVEDMRFVQTYLAIPFAMVILCLTLVPFFIKMRNFSAYEVLEERFGLPTRLFTAFLFLMSRGLALGTVIAAPSYVLALLLDFPLTWTILIIGTIATLYTMVGGISGVIFTDVKQMAVMAFGLLFSFGWIMYQLPDSVGLGDTLYLAGSIDKLTTFDPTFDISEKYNVWSGVIAALFLMLSYFGTDQTQVQRYLTAKSLKDARKSLLLTAYAKVPMQFFILLLGVMLYVFFVFNPAPLSFRAAAPPSGPETEQVVQQYEQLHEERRTAALSAITSRSPEATQTFQRTDRQLNKLREQEIDRREHVLQQGLNDTNYIFPYFILSHIPVGIVGLLVAGIFAAALSSIDSELNALSTVTIVDWYRRWHQEEKSERHYLRASRATTVLWGMLATLAAVALGETNSIIELVNQIGSYFYGSILGVFVLMLWVKSANGWGAFTGLLAGMGTVFLFDRLYWLGTELTFIGPGTLLPDHAQKAIEYLWLNPVGTFTVVVVGWTVSQFIGNSRKQS
ncbi:MAG: sodium:solute symporter [Bacteroidota bacterium]